MSPERIRSKRKAPRKPISSGSPKDTPPRPPREIAPGPPAGDAEDQPPTIYGKQIEIRRPVVVVPGIMGSDLFGPIPGTGLPSTRRVWPPFSGTTGELTVTPIVDLVDVKDKVATAGMVFMACYEPLLNFLRSIGYSDSTDPRTLHLFPYDWTLSNRTTGRRLASKIRRIIQGTPWSSVDVVCHSMGGLVTRGAINLFAAPVEKTVYLASPHWGSPKAYFSLHPRINYGFFGSGWTAAAVDLLIKATLGATGPFGPMKDVSTKIDSMYELLPDPNYLTAVRPIAAIRRGAAVRPVVGEPATYYTTRETAFPPSMRPTAARALRFKRDIGARPPGRHLSLFSDQKSTDDRVTYDYNRKITLLVNGVYPVTIREPGFDSPYDSGQKGDGTVATASAKVGNVGATVNASHVWICSHPGAHEQIYTFLGTP